VSARIVHQAKIDLTPQKGGGREGRCPTNSVIAKRD